MGTYTQEEIQRRVGEIWLAINDGNALDAAAAAEMTTKTWEKWRALCDTNRTRRKSPAEFTVHGEAGAIYIIKAIGFDQLPSGDLVFFDENGAAKAFVRKPMFVEVD